MLLFVGNNHGFKRLLFSVWLFYYLFCLFDVICLFLSYFCEEIVAAQIASQSVNF